MSKTKKSLLPKVEVLIILVFFLSFIAWAATKCNATKLNYEQEALANTSTENISEETPTNDQSSSEATVVTDPAEQQATPTAASETSSNPTAATTPAIPANSELSRLYVTIEGLKLREEPSLESEVIRQFALFDEVYFMNEITDFKLEINLGKEMANEPWVKVKSKKGHIGWVYGAGVHYHKQKRSGVE
jgi:hypothetical protein